MIQAQTFKRTLMVTPRAMTNSATVTANLDCIGADYATIVVALKSEINTNAVGPTISLLASDDTTVTNFATVVADRTAEAFVNGKQIVYQIDRRSSTSGRNKRYLRISVTTATATNDDITVGVIGELSRLKEMPGSTSEMVGSTNDVVVSLT